MSPADLDGATPWLLASASAIAGLLAILWWRGRNPRWILVAIFGVVAGLGYTLASHRLFVVPDYTAGCATAGCHGWTGFPIPVTCCGNLSEFQPWLFVLAMLHNTAFALVASVGIGWLAIRLGWGEWPLKAKGIFCVLLIVLPLALAPRYIAPPEPDFADNDLRVAINARRLAQIQYNALGFRVHRLAVEDVRELPSLRADRPGGYRACLRAYTYFYIPWRRILIELDNTGVRPTDMQWLPLQESCWETQDQPLADEPSDVTPGRSQISNARLQEIFH